jgi:rare lipoprotein A
LPSDRPHLPLPRRFELQTARIRVGLTLAVLAGLLGVGGCAQSPQQLTASHGKEYFPSSVYGPASRRVIADGQPVPRGGGRYLVGKPYSVAGQTYYPNTSRKTQVGLASWYGDAFHGRLTANGEIYDRDSLSAASPTLPLPSYVRVTNLRNNSSMVVRVNDRGPYASNRIMDVSRRVADALDFRRFGTTELKVEYIGLAGLAGSDDAKLYATLRTDGEGQRTRFAAKPTRTRVASLAPYAPPQASDDGDIDAPKPRPRSALPSRPRVADEEPTAPPRPTRASSDAWRRKVVAALDPDPASSRFSRVERGSPVPPPRPLDLGTIPGAATAIHARRDSPPLRLARSPDD